MTLRKRKWHYPKRMLSIQKKGTQGHTLTFRSAQQQREHPAARQQLARTAARSNASRLKRQQPRESPESPFRSATIATTRRVGSARTLSALVHPRCAHPSPSRIRSTTSVSLACESVRAPSSVPPKTHHASGKACAAFSKHNVCAARARS